PPCLRQSGNLPLMRDTDVFAKTAYVSCTAFSIDNLIVKGHPPALHLGDPTAHRQTLAVSGRMQIASVNFRNHQIMSAGFKAGIIVTTLPGVVGAALLKVDDITGMMHNTHCICFGIANVKRCFYNDGIAGLQASTSTFF